MLSRRQKQLKAAWLVVLGVCIQWCGATVPLDITITNAPYGAIPNDGLDDAPAFQRALDDIYTATNGAIFIPSGSYTLDSQVVFRTTTARIVSLRGEGTNSTVIHCTSTNGGFLLTSTNAPRLTVFARDMALVADRAGAGTAFAVISPESGIRQTRALVVENLLITRATATDYFDYGLVVNGQHRGVFRNVVFEGPEPTGDLSDTAPIFKPMVGIRLNGSYGGVFYNCRVSSAATAFEMKSDAGEGGSYDGCTADYCRIGCDIYTPGQEPGFSVTDSSIRARDVGVRIERRRIGFLTGNEFSTLPGSDAYPYKDVYLTNVRMIELANNVFIAGHANRVCFTLDGEMSGNLGPKKPSSVIIDHNDFNMDRINAISIGSYVTGVRILNNEYY
ncbi:MAG: glycoside hydrolase family 55 protein [Kiritimatiellales bacterium]|nr:glycoside hydrolase family 55 protein [Kiritimatiellales bacterium]MCF7863482.1 glycoside hydrolase family 55 protein [Kiritimatiellales bacterium]